MQCLWPDLVTSVVSLPAHRPILTARLSFIAPVCPLRLLYTYTNLYTLLYMWTITGIVDVRIVIIHG